MIVPIRARLEQLEAMGTGAGSWLKVRYGSISLSLSNYPSHSLVLSHSPLSPSPSSPLPPHARTRTRARARTHTHTQRGSLQDLRDGIAASTLAGHMPQV